MLECLNPQHLSHGIYLDCGECLTCEQENKSGVLKSRFTKEQLDGIDKTKRLQSVPALQDQDQRSLGHALSAGMPKQYMSTILDIDVRRQRLAHISGKGRERTLQEIYYSIAQLREVPGEHPADPLLWMFRIWDYLWASPLPSTRLEQRLYRANRDTIPRWPPEAPLAYKAMAARALRLLPCDYKVYEICCEVCVETGSVLYERRDGTVPKSSRYTREYQFPSQCTRAWIGWVSFASGKNIPIPHPAMGSTAFHRIRWETMALRSDHVQTMARFMPEIWTNPREAFKV